MININICHRCAWPNSWTPWGILLSDTSLPEVDSTQGRYQVRLVDSTKYEVPKQIHKFHFTVLQHDLYIIHDSDIGINQQGVMNQKRKRILYTVTYSDLACWVWCDVVIKVVSGGDGKFPLLTEGVKTVWLSRLTNAWCTVQKYQRGLLCVRAC